MNNEEPNPLPLAHIHGMPRRRYHFHVPGLLYVIVTFFLAVGAINSQNNLLFASLGLAMGGLLISGVLSGAALIGLRVERVLPGSARVGGQETVVYRARNVNRLIPAFGLTIAELGESTTWGKHIRPVRGFVAHVGAGGEAETRVVVEPRRRGKMTFDVTRVYTTFPFGLAKKSVSFGAPGSVVVHPVELPVRNGLLNKLTARAVVGAGALVRPGLGDDFYGLREYLDGDNPRWIAWRRSARTGQLVVRQNTTPTPRSLWIVIRVPERPEARLVERAIALAAAVARGAFREGASLGLAVPALGIEMAPRADSRGLRLIQDGLAVMDVEGADAARRFPAGAATVSASVVIHAGEIDRSFGTSRSYHIAAGSPEEILIEGDATASALALLDATEALV